MKIIPILLANWKVVMTSEPQGEGEPPRNMVKLEGNEVSEDGVVGQGVKVCVRHRYQCHAEDLVFSDCRKLYQLQGATERMDEIRQMNAHIEEENFTPSYRSENLVSELSFVIKGASVELPMPLAGPDYVGLPKINIILNHYFNPNYLAERGLLGQRAEYIPAKGIAKANRNFFEAAKEGMVAHLHEGESLLVHFGKAVHHLDDAGEEIRLPANLNMAEFDDLRVFMSSCDVGFILGPENEQKGRKLVGSYLVKKVGEPSMHRMGLKATCYGFGDDLFGLL